MKLKDLLFEMQGMSTKELSIIRQAADTLTSNAEKLQQEKATTLAELQAIAIKHGYTLEELVTKAAMPEKATRAKPAQKYCNPTDSSMTWSGRGRKPRWFTAALEAGQKPEDLYIQKVASGNR